MDKSWFDNKARMLLASVISFTAGPMLAAWNGQFSWHVAIGLAAGADITAFLTWLIPNGEVVPTIPAGPPPKVAAKGKK